MKVVSAKLMRCIDHQAAQIYKIPLLILMENAAIASAFCALKMLRVGQKKVTVFCGPGNNGGDGFACARHLLNRGLQVKVYFEGSQDRLSGEAKVNYTILRKIGQKILKPKIGFLKKQLDNVDLIVDALLGIGLKDLVRAPFDKIIETINSSNKPVLSLDIPSGLDATSGKICGVAVKARHTVTFGLLKKGLLNPKAKKYTGQVTVADISLPRQLLH